MLKEEGGREHQVMRVARRWFFGTHSVSAAKERSLHPLVLAQPERCGWGADWLLAAILRHGARMLVFCSILSSVRVRHRTSRHFHTTHAFTSQHLWEAGEKGTSLKSSSSRAQA